MQGMVAGKRSSGKPIQRWEKYITDMFGTMTAAGRVAENMHHRDIHGSNVICLFIAFIYQG